MKSQIPDCRPVPWTGADVALIFLLWFSLTILCVRFYTFGLENEIVSGESTTKHPLTQLIERGRERPVVLLVAFFGAVVMAPVTEELLFRLVFQGWLRKQTAELERRFLKQNTSWLSAAVSIFLVSLVFAAMHGGRRTEQSVDILFYGILAIATANVLTCLFGVIYLHRVCGAEWSDFGVRVEKIPFDFLLGIGVFFLCAPVILSLHWLIQECFPGAATDPIPLFLFSLILGTLIDRTGRLSPCIVVHGCLNGFSFMTLLLYV